MPIEAISQCHSDYRLNLPSLKLELPITDREPVREEAVSLSELVPGFFLSLQPQPAGCVAALACQVVHPPSQLKFSQAARHSACTLAVGLTGRQRSSGSVVWSFNATIPAACTRGLATGQLSPGRSSSCTAARSEWGRRSSPRRLAIKPAAWVTRCCSRTCSRPSAVWPSAPPSRTGWPFGAGEGEQSGDAPRPRQAADHAACEDVAVGENHCDGLSQPVGVGDLPLLHQPVPRRHV